MAQISDVAGIPTVQPETTAPDIIRRIPTNPSEFGAAIGQGLEKAGEGASAAGQFWGQIQTDHNIYDANGTATDIVEKFKGLRGQDALDAQAETDQTLQDTYKQARGQLKTAAQQLQFDKDTRSFYQHFLQPQIYTHANQQATEYAKTTNENGYKQSQDVLAALDPSDPDYEAKADAIKGQGIRAALKNAHLQLGGNASDDDVRDYVRPYMQNLVKTQAQTMAVKDPARAADFIDRPDVRGLIGIDYPRLSSEFRTRATEQQALGVVQDAKSSTAQTMASPSPQTQAMSVREAILQQESGNNGAAATSVNGAVGPGQIRPQTFAQYAKPGEDIANPVDNRAVSARIIDDYAKKFDGDPARIAVAYFSGPGNVSPAGSPTPFVADVRDGNGKSVSSYVQDVTTRLGSQAPILAARSNMYDLILDKTKDNPPLRQAALRELNQQMNAAEIASLSDQKALKAQQEATLDTYYQGIKSGKITGTPWQQDSSLPVEKKVYLDNLNRETLSDAINGKPGDWGPGISDIQSRILDPTSPNPITSRGQILDEYGRHNINAAGLNKAGEWLDWASKGNIGERNYASSFYKAAKDAVTLEEEDSKYKVPGSEKQWLSALGVLDDAIDTGRKNGLTDRQMMDPKSKDSVWPMLDPYLPPKGAQLHAAITKDAAQAAGVSDWKKITTVDDALAKLKTGAITYQQAQTLWDAHPEWHETPGK